MAHQAMFRTVEIRHCVKRAKLARFSPLAVGDVQHRQAVIKVGNCRGDAAIHAAAGKNDGEWLVRGPWWVVRGHSRVVASNDVVAASISISHSTCSEAC